ncbi:MAG: hypothetical protein AAFP03_18065 [Cyanobacteria bacterium J06598_3]
MENINPLTSDKITRIHVTAETNGSFIDAALNEKTGTVVLINDQGIQITLTPSDRKGWDNRLAPPST